MLAEGLGLSGIVSILFTGMVSIYIHMALAAIICYVFFLREYVGVFFCLWG